MLSYSIMLMPTVSTVLQAVEDMCRHQMQDRLYKQLQAACDAHIAQQLAALQAHTQLAPAAFLEHVAGMWDDYCSQMLRIRSIFLYLDRTYVMSLPGLRSLFDTGLASLRHHLTEHPKVRHPRVQHPKAPCGSCIDNDCAAHSSP
eukprot:GHRQ01039435.1.p1 GENE.GHRQ01039435.1~~GHRQ01039435.1.p1  ORF type:complete len:145 (-),score=51.45 GHRQ01039435.1:170-604(-)